MSIDGEWQSLSKAAATIGVQERSLRRYVEGRDDRPKLESKTVNGKLCVQPGAAYEHLKTHEKRKFRTLRAPEGYDPVRRPAFDAEIVRALEGIDPSTVDPHELAWKLLCAGVAREKIQSAVAVANSLQRKHDATARAGKNFIPDDVVKMVRAFAALFVDEVDQGSTRFALELIRAIREQLGIDLSKNANAASIIDQFHRESFGNGVISALRGRVEDQVRGIQSLNF